MCALRLQLSCYSMHTTVAQYSKQNVNFAPTKLYLLHTILISLHPANPSFPVDLKSFTIGLPSYDSYEKLVRPHKALSEWSRGISNLTAEDFLRLPDLIPIPRQRWARHFVRLGEDRDTTKLVLNKRRSNDFPGLVSNTLVVFLNSLR